MQVTWPGVNDFNVCLQCRQTLKSLTPAPAADSESPIELLRIWSLYLSHERGGRMPGTLTACCEARVITAAR
jgi:hypothetical protein